MLRYNGREIAGALHSRRRAATIRLRPSERFACALIARRQIGGWATWPCTPDLVRV